MPLPKRISRNFAATLSCISLALGGSIGVVIGHEVGKNSKDQQLTGLFNNYVDADQFEAQLTGGLENLQSVRHDINLLVDHPSFNLEFRQEIAKLKSQIDLIIENCVSLGILKNTTQSTILEYISNDNEASYNEAMDQISRQESRLRKDMINNIDSYESIFDSIYENLDTYLRGTDPKLAEIARRALRMNTPFWEPKNIPSP